MAKIKTTSVKGKGTNSTYSGTMPCNICRGTGRVKKPTKKKK